MALIRGKAGDAAGVSAMAGGRAPPGQPGEPGPRTDEVEFGPVRGDGPARRDRRSGRAAELADTGFWPDHSDAWNSGTTQASSKLAGRGNPGVQAGEERPHPPSTVMAHKMSR